ncbi:hypothetical protein [Achromobacter xylosoxidans]|uniref:hypothetical protein n=1 Tax=Alcaligenes xylosoxydans xylosoxydans TaxID=85698 RepID=UPI002449398E|nr:hypothetical protein [Achromobacter xylosoxidans]MDH0520837.1 hypothetical protein [Achromobacter xylosoxidans]MDH0544809.1 hypothetical protein [Achromobacter xylosoxidans]
MNSPIKLPELPVRADWHDALGVEVFTASQMRAYAEQAVRDALAAQQNEGLASLRVWWAMVEAHAELADEPIGDEDPILHFMGSGASHQVTAGDIRGALQWKPSPKENNHAEGADK